MLRSETEGDPARMAAALAGLRAYQTAARPERPRAMPIIASAGRATLADYGGSGRPVIVIPSLINSPDVLDLLPDHSLMRWLATRGLRPLLIDWGSPTPDERDLDLADHIERLLVPLIETIGSDAALVGYCLGGTMAVAAAAIRPPAGLALIAAPWHFSGFPEDARRGLAALWAQARPSAEAMGMLPLEVLQSGFWRLDPARTVGKFVAFGARDQAAADIRRFVALEDWANDGAALTAAAGRELVLDFFGQDRPGRGTWRVAGRAIDPSALACPTLDIVSTTDRIVPAASAANIGRRLTLAQGHVGMMVGGRARTLLWEPLARWLSDPTAR
ncbi:alpha/beta fold hydrolase [uncultured Sphingomonas sp.]|uniref:alpha/beta fold hydrolase n=1 Tax=uncultured Sphingomonas sp. TaxID=158754 RepID=UPI0026086B6C|nr:alpha/beta fold hydrolase [uncultured Sphingomonas sp.]